MHELLQKPATDGFPRDFLLSRLRGRKPLLVVIEREHDSWERLQADYAWIYRAMRPGLRRIFAPCFLVFEWRTLQMLLRAVVGRDQPQVERLCRNSLLDRQWLQQLAKSADAEGFSAVLDRWLTLLPASDSLVGHYRKGGTRVVESELVDRLFCHLAAGPGPEAVKTFVMGQIDLRNLLTTARYLRWELGSPPLVAGGGEHSRQLRMARDRGSLEKVVQRAAGTDSIEPALIESRLLTRFGRQLVRLGRDPLGAGLVVDYLWRRYRAFRSSGLHVWVGEDVGFWEEAV